MQITQLNNYNNYQNRAYTSNFKQIAPSKGYQPRFTSIAGAATEAATTAAQKPEGWFGKFADWIAKNYFVKFYNSKPAKYIVAHTNSPKWNNMTTHMSALGSTLISGMYAVRTLENDKLDPEKRKTLAINDVLTWAVSTAGAYFLDAKLAKACDKATTRYAANYLQNNKDSKEDVMNKKILGEWDAKDLRSMMKNWYEHVNPDTKEGKELLQEIKQQAVDNLNTQFDTSDVKPLLKTWLNQIAPDSAEMQEVKKALGEEKLTKLTEGLALGDKELSATAKKEIESMAETIRPTLKKWIAALAPDSNEAFEFLKKTGKLSYRNIADFNVDILRNPKLTTHFEGIETLKSLLVFGMVYRYIVPVLVMKPANYIGHYIHEQNAKKAQASETKQA